MAAAVGASVYGLLVLYIGGVVGIYQLVVDPGLGSEDTELGTLVGPRGDMPPAVAFLGSAGWLLFAYARRGRGSLWPVAPLSVVGLMFAVASFAFSLACCSGG